MIWGYAGVWLGQYLKLNGRPYQSLMPRLEFLAEWGLKCTDWSARDLAGMAAPDREAALAYIAGHDLSLSLWAGGGYFGEAAEARRIADESLAAVRRYKEAVRAPIAVTGAGDIHRFVKKPPLDEQLGILAARLAPVAAGCREMGLELGIENHGDYYVSDMVELCRRVPNLRLRLDTGNCYLIGEKTLPAIREGAPFSIGTHFKDHVVRPRPDARPLHFEVGGSVLGEGDVGLREAYDILLQHAPDPKSLVMAIELVPPDGMDPVEALRRSLAFVRSLPEP